MAEEGTITITIILILGVLLFTGLIIGGCYAYRKVNLNNFQTTIKDLSEEQKCIYICGFEFHGYMEHYKFCTEKCDRISERLKGGIE